MRPRLLHLIPVIGYVIYAIRKRRLIRNNLRQNRPLPPNGVSPLWYDLYQWFAFVTAFTICSVVTMPATNAAGKPLIALPVVSVILVMHSALYTIVTIRHVIHSTFYAKRYGTATVTKNLGRLMVQYDVLYKRPKK